jgi:hypothetical protein
MFVSQHDLAAFTHQTDHHEPNLSFHLANELWTYFSWLNCDFDVKKTNYNKRPDIIFHRRGRNRFNQLVVEVKRKSNLEVANWICENDENKILNFWFMEPLSYLFGASVVLDEQTSEFAFALYQNNPRRAARFPQENFQIDIEGENEIRALVNQITLAKRENVEADTHQLEESIDEMIYQTYGLNDMGD